MTVGQVNPGTFFRLVNDNELIGNTVFLKIIDCKSGNAVNTMTWSVCKLEQWEMAFTKEIHEQ